MVKYVIRTKTVPCVSSNLRMADPDCRCLREYMDQYGRASLLHHVFAEDIGFAELENAYDDFLEKGKSELFSWMYQLDSGWGVVIDEHIALCRFDHRLREEQLQLLRWMYVDSQLYIGDTWWFEPQEILNDLNQMTMMRFFEKYKGM